MHSMVFFFAGIFVMLFMIIGLVSIEEPEKHIGKITGIILGGFITMTLIALPFLL